MRVNHDQTKATLDQQMSASASLNPGLASMAIQLKAEKYRGKQVGRVSPGFFVKLPTPDRNAEPPPPPPAQTIPCVRVVFCWSAGDRERFGRRARLRGDLHGLRDGGYRNHHDSPADYALRETRGGGGGSVGAGVPSAVRRGRNVSQ